MAGFALIFAGLMAVDIWLMARYARNESFGQPDGPAEDGPNGLFSGAVAK